MKYRTLHKWTLNFVWDFCYNITKTIEGFLFLVNKKFPAKVYLYKKWDSETGFLSDSFLIVDYSAIKYISLKVRNKNSMYREVHIPQYMILIKLNLCASINPSPILYRILSSFSRQQSHITSMKDFNLCNMPCQKQNSSRQFTRGWNQ